MQNGEINEFLIGVSMTKILTTTISALLITSLVLSSTSWAIQSEAATITPIKNVVVIFQENISYDHYFGTYPVATNPSGEPAFTAAGDTPHSNGLTPELLTHNPNLANPFRLDRTQAITCDMNHDYLAEQQAYDGGSLDKFVQATGSTGTNCKPDGSTVMAYYDGNTVTGLWNYAQHFAMSDNSFSTMFGPSTPGAINLVSGQTSGASDGTVLNGQVIGDPDPAFDDCSHGTTISMSGKNIGDLLNEKGISWGWFQGGFAPSSTSGGKVVCGTKTPRTQTDNALVTAYSPHHEPFQYYASTSNPHHGSPASIDEIGHDGPANHQYDLSSFTSAVHAGKMPAVSFLKAARAQDGHPGNSDPLDEQKFLVDTINMLENSPEWSSTAVFILYDDSDGWYDHVMPPIINNSNDPNNDFAPTCGGNQVLGDIQDRCGHGPRQPLLVISPYAKSNFISHDVSDQTSVLKFIEDNWKVGEIPDGTSFDEKARSIENMFDFGNHGSTPAVILDDTTGEATH